MEDKSIFDKSQPQGISDPLRNFIEALVEEVVKEEKPFDDTKKKWLRKYSENEGLDYESLEKNLTDLFETLPGYQSASGVIQRMIRTLANECHVSQSCMERLVKGSESGGEIEIAENNVIRICKFTTTGLVPDYNNVCYVKIADEPFAEGGLGRLFHVLEINGEAVKTSQVIKVFKGNRAAHSYETIRGVQDGLMRKKAELDQQGIDFIECYPAFWSAPQFVFEGELNGEAVRGYSANNLNEFGYYSIADVLYDESLLDRFDTIRMENRYAKAYHLMRAFAVLEEIHFIHTGFNTNNLFVSLNDDGRCAMIDFDSGVIVNNKMDEDVADVFWIDMLMPPEIRRQAIAKQPVTVNLLNNNWSAAVACHYLLTMLGPFCFLREPSEKVIMEYNHRFEWPNVSDGFPFLDKDALPFTEFLQSLYVQFSQGIVQCFRNTFSKGYFDQHCRTTFNQWCAELEPHVPRTESRARLSKPLAFRPLKTLDELVIFVLDGSCSMDELTVGHISKADAVSMAVNELFERMKKSRMGINYSFAIVAYDHRSEVKMQITETKNLDDRGDYNPMKGLGGGACISEGLKEAKMIAKDFLSESKMGGLMRDVTVIIMSDGIDMKPGETISLANSLKQMPQVQIASCFIETLGTDAGLLQERADFLKSLCSSNFSCMDLNCDDLFRCFYEVDRLPPSSVML